MTNCRPKALYLAVTADKYELPLYIADSPQELADRYGLKKKALLCMLSNHIGGYGKGKNKPTAKRWYRRVYIDEEE